jgi:hypothetical protein
MTVQPDETGSEVAQARRPNKAPAFSRVTEGKVG